MEIIIREDPLHVGTGFVSSGTPPYKSQEYVSRHYHIPKNNSLTILAT
jgi:hypothetical protein